MPSESRISRSPVANVAWARVLGDVDRSWTRTFAAADLPKPRVAFEAVSPGAVRLTTCGILAGDSAAFYCPLDDTIVVAQQFAADLYRGVLRGLPGEQTGYGRRLAVAYVLAQSTPQPPAGARDL